MARKYVARLLSPATIDRVRPYNIAAIYAALSETDLAFQWLDRPFANWTERLRMLRFDPRLDGLRADPRFLHDDNLTIDAAPNNASSDRFLPLQRPREQAFARQIPRNVLVLD
jgi:hypothetical protein